MEIYVEPDSLCLGVVVGLVVAYVVGSFVRHILWHRGRIHGFFSPQTVTHETNQTPCQKFWEACTSLIFLCFLGAMLVLVVYILWLRRL